MPVGTPAPNATRTDSSHSSNATQPAGPTNVSNNNNGKVEPPSAFGTGSAGSEVESRPLPRFPVPPIDTSKITGVVPTGMRGGSAGEKRPSIFSSPTAHPNDHEESLAIGRSGRRGSDGSFTAGMNSTIEVTMHWHDVLVRYGGLEASDAAAVAESFGKLDMPAPSNDAQVYLTHEFLKEIGVTEAHLRARVILACRRMPAVRNLAAPGDESRKLLDKFAPENASTNSGAINASPDTSFESDWSLVRLREYQSQQHGYIWYDLKGNDLDLDTKKSPEFDQALCDLLRKLGEEQLDSSPLRNSFDMKSHHTVSGEHADMPHSPAYNLISGILDAELPLPHLRVDPVTPACAVFVMRVCTLDNVKEEDDTVRELTNRWTVYIDSANSIVATIHRVDSIALSSLRDRWTSTQHLPFNLFITKLLDRFLAEYQKALSINGEWLDRCEEQMLASTSDTMLTSLFHLQRRCSVYDRMIELTRILVERDVARQLRMSDELATIRPQFGALQERCHELQSRAQNLLEIHLSLVGYRSNELMKVLTKFSIFFTPITFIAGHYGQNFANFPELTYHGSYYIVLGVMALCIIVTFVWLQLRKW